MMLAAHGTVMLKMSPGVIVGVVGVVGVVGLFGQHRGMVEMMGHCTGCLLARGCRIAHGMRGPAFHGDGRERLNR